MVGVKFRAAGFQLNGQMLSWLKKMNTENVVFYEKGTNHGNQRVWAATGAAIHALLDRDPEALRFQDQVWHEGKKDLLGPDWARCLPENVTPFEWGSGGDPRRSAEILSELAHRRSKRTRAGVDRGRV